MVLFFLPTFPGAASHPKRDLQVSLENFFVELGVHLDIVRKDLHLAQLPIAKAGPRQLSTLAS